MDQVNNGICIQPIPSALITAIVVRKLIPVRVEEATALSDLLPRMLSRHGH